MDLDKLRKRLEKFNDFYESQTDWYGLTEFVALMVLKARKADLEWSLDPNQDGTVFGDPYKILEDRIANITAEITKIKEG